AAKVLRETLPQVRKPFQVYSSGGMARSVHGTAYTRLFDEEVLSVVNEFSDDFTPAPRGFNGATGLYAGEQDMFCFLIDENSRIEIREESFAPGLFVWTSEVGKRSVGISTFWYQHVCSNHIVWDAIDVVECTRKHTANVHRCLNDMRSAIENLIAVRDQRRDAFAKTVDVAMDTRFAESRDEAIAVLRRHGLSADLLDETHSSREYFTVFDIVDAITRVAGRLQNAGDRLLLDARAAALLTLAA
ncbi:MAG: hypothetical protein KDB23_12415, partial [Planctomycetales bacterium]|nr:hypothetical protein [Planctomycetales bacterium]